MWSICETTTSSSAQPYIQTYVNVCCSVVLKKERIKIETHSSRMRPHFRFRTIGPRNLHALTNLTNQTAKLSVWWSLMVHWLALLTRIQGDVNSIPARGNYTNFSDKCLFFLSLILLNNIHWYINGKQKIFSTELLIFTWERTSIYMVTNSSHFFYLWELLFPSITFIHSNLYIR